MKSRTSSSHENGNGNGSHDLVARVASTARIAQAARKHYKMLKAEYRQARKAFKQAKKAAKRARKEAKAAGKLLKSKNGLRTHDQKVKAVRGMGRKTKIQASRGKQNRQTIPLPAAMPTTVAASV